MKFLFSLLIFTALETTCFAAAAVDNKQPAPSVSTNSNLPLVLLSTQQPIVPITKVPCTVLLVMPQSAKAGQTLTGAVRIHGASSQGYPKKSYALALDAPVRWLGMRETAHWVLNAAFVDRSIMRHKLSYDLFRSLSSTNAPRFASASRFVEVNVNGKYTGAYLLMERVDRGMLGLRSFQTNAPQHACIYKAIDHTAFLGSGHGGFEQREPDPLTSGPYWGPLDQLQRFVSSASDRDFFDPVKGIAARFDLDNAIDFHLLLLLTSNMDGFDKNLILARDAPSSNAPAPRFFFVPWDYDATFGRNWEGSSVGTTAWLSNHLLDRLSGDPAYRKKFADRWKQLRQREFSVPVVHRMIDDNVEALGAAAERNAGRWRGFGGRTLQQDVAEMKAWVAQRVKHLDKEINPWSVRK